MKPAFGSLLILIALAGPALLAQQTPELVQTSILSVSGETSWGIAINGHAVGFKLSEPHQHVTITARLGNGGGHAYADAFLMRAIGPRATENDEVARFSFELAYPYSEWVTLFEDLDLGAGTYWLVVARPREKAFSSINWFVAKPMILKSGCAGITYLGTQSYTFNSDAADYIPASNFKKKYEPYGFQIELFEPGARNWEDCSQVVKAAAQ